MVKRKKTRSKAEATARNTHKRALKKSERRFQDLIFTMGDWVWEMDETGRYTYCSESVSPILGYSPEEIIGKTPFDFMPEDEAERIQAIFSNSAKERSSFKDSENWLITKSGKHICIVTSGVPIIDEKGVYKGYQGVSKDITAHKLEEQRLTRLCRCLSTLGVDYKINIRLIVETAGEILDACCAYYSRWGEGILSTVFAWQAPNGFGVNPGNDSVCYEALQRPGRETLFIPRLRESRFALLDPSLGAYGMNAFLGQPVYAEGKPRGVLCAFFREGKPPKDAVNLMEMFGEVLAREEERFLSSKQQTERETFLRTLIESTIDAIAVLDVNRRFMDVNEAFCKMFGYTREEVIGKDTTLIHVSEEKAAEFGKIIYPVIRKKGYWQGEWQLKRRDGMALAIESITAVLKDEAGDVSGYVAFIRDITERKEAESALREAHERLAQIVSAIHSILIGLSAEGDVTAWNREAEEILGLKEADVLGKRLGMCEISWEWERIEQGIQRCEKDREITRVDDVRLTDIEGKERFLGVTLNPVLNAEGDLVGTLIFAADITQKKIMEAQLLQAQKMESIGQLAAGIAHEINSPTQFVGDNLSFLKDAFEDLNQLTEKYEQLVEQARSSGLFSDLLEEIKEISEEVDIDFLREEIPKALGQSTEGIKRVSHIVQAMKEFSHPGVKEKEWVDLNKAIETTVTVSKNAWKYVAELVMHLDPSLEPVLCMPDEINQVILNLIVNAAQAIEEVVGGDSGEKGLITIDTHNGGKWVEVRVQDTGSGIPESIRNRIFDPFFTTKEVGKGTGQGLAIAYDVVVQKHGGVLTFETYEGKGTTFIMRLPKQTEKAEK